jgi:arylsulfatase
VPRSNDLTEEEERDFKKAKLDKFLLYNLRDDIGETRDLAKEQPAKFAELKTQLEKKYLEVRAELPTWPAWKFTNAEGIRIEWPEYVKNRAQK